MTSAGTRLSGPTVAWLALAAGCGVLAYGLWSERGILLDQPSLWPDGAAWQVLLCAGAYVLVALLLRALPALAARLAATTLVVAFVAVVSGPQALLGAILLGAGCLAAGDLLVGRLRTDPGLALRLLLSLLTGATLFALLVTFTAHFPVNRAVFFALVCAAVVAVDARGLASLAGRAAAWYRRPRAPGGGWAYASAALLGALLLLQSVRALLPETGGDGLGMHLVVASQLAAHHQWTFDPVLFEWGLFPMASEWLQGIAWSFAGEPAARIVQFAAMLISVALIVTAARRFVAPAAALLAASLFASAGLALGLAANTYAEPALTALLLGAFVVVCTPRDDWSVWTTVVFGVLCGGSLLTKVTALYVLPLLAAILILRLVRAGGWRYALRHTGVAAALVVGVGAWPYAYAWWRTGNPVFPLYNEVFRSSLAPLERPLDPRWHGHFSWKLPYTATFFTSGFNEAYNGTLGFQYLVLAPLALVVAACRRLWVPAAAFGAGLVAAAALLSGMQYVRYVFPMMALASIGLAAALAGGQTPPWRWVTRAATAVALLVVALNLVFAPGGQWNLPGFEARALVFSDARRAYEDKYAPQRALTAMVNDLAGGDARVAYFGPAYAAGLQGTPHLAMGYNPEFQREYQEAVTAGQVLDALRERDVEYVIAPLSLTPPGTPLGDAMSRHAEQLAEVNGAALYRLRR